MQLDGARQHDRFTLGETSLDRIVRRARTTNDDGPPLDRFILHDEHVSAALVGANRLPGHEQRTRMGLDANPDVNIQIRDELAVIVVHRANDLADHAVPS